ncbi:hypothetical protein [Sphingomonas sp. ID1715]|nr:hypothetical protein [Sphingomonas sp. ID1715]
MLERQRPRAAPRLGAHSGEVLSDLLHLGDAEIARPAEDGVVALG